ncbi:hypothetical protein RT717_12005 [Imperialibacter roseus]|uniref:Uncharacterized protein n=1 Tax=Imperialibacter roseus TaxID=1324217 RepID=A0ABZ0IWE5_9BACT|nr:hypothetical protein [Imperialibacter roseus]WOK09363.1 hypothetical protein RT717_12005 [Imperialibacter roseus]
MEALEKARLALREHLANNKAKVKADLERLRKKSVGDDLFSYIGDHSKSFAFEEMVSVPATVVDAPLTSVDNYILECDLIGCNKFVPPDKPYRKHKEKDPAIVSGSFFL